MPPLPSPPHQLPTPRLTGGQDKREQLVPDTCPHPVSWGPRACHGQAVQGSQQGGRQLWGLEGRPVVSGKA